MGNRLRLALEAERIVWIGLIGRIDHLDCHAALEANIDAAVHARHAAMPQHRFEAIFVQLFPDQAVFGHGKNTSHTPAAISQRATSCLFHKTRNWLLSFWLIQKT